MNPELDVDALAYHVVFDDMTLGAEAKWGEAQDDDFAMSASFGFDEISATLATVVDVREDDNEGDVAMSFTVTDGGAELFFVALALTGATDQPSAQPMAQPRRVLVCRRRLHGRRLLLCPHPPRPAASASFKRSSASGGLGPSTSTGPSLSLV